MLWKVQCSTPGGDTLEFFVKENMLPNPVRGVTIIAQAKYLPTGEGPYAVELDNPLKFVTSSTAQYYVIEWKDKIISNDDFMKIKKNWEKERGSNNPH